MTEHRTDIEKINSYGVLITVLSVFLAIVYASSDYDIFDLTISSIIFSFGLIYICKKVYFDFFSKFLSLLICTSSLTIIVFSMVTFKGTCITDIMENSFFALSVSISYILALLMHNK